MRGSTSSLAYDSATRSENWESTSYGVARVPYTSRLATRWTRSRTGWKPTATMPVARMERPRLGLPPLPTRAPMPTAMPTYTAVMNTASEPYTRVRLMTTSMSYSRYLSTAIMMPTGSASPCITRSGARIAVAKGVRVDGEIPDTMEVAAKISIVSSAANANHLI